MSDSQDFLGQLLSREKLTKLGRVAATKAAQSLGIRKEANGDMMIAWYPAPDLAAALASLAPDGEAPEDLHLTIIYIPAEREVNPDVVAACTLICAQYADALEGEISGVGRFCLDAQNDVFFATVDVPRLDDLRRNLLEYLERAGVWLNDKHGFTPHISLKYLPRYEASPCDGLAYKVPIKLDALTVAIRDGQHVTFALNDWGKAEASEDEVAATRPTEPAALRMFERATEAGMKGCTKCGSPMIEKDDDWVCVKCEKEAAKNDCPDCDGEECTCETPDEEALKSLVYLALPVTKADGGKEWQYTMGPLYVPGRLDAHEEYAEDDDLHRAVLEYSLKSDRRMRLQHDKNVQCGTWVELMRWPYEHEIDITKPGEATRKIKMPAGTVYMGVLWDDAAWELVKSGKLGGLSLGGRAVRVEGDASAAQLPIMGDA